MLVEINYICNINGIAPGIPVATVAINGAMNAAILAVQILAVLPPKWLCTDNAAMIGAEGYIQYSKGNFADLDLNAIARINFN